MSMVVLRSYTKTKSVESDVWCLLTRNDDDGWSGTTGTWTDSSDRNTLCSNLEITEGEDVEVNEDVDEWEPSLLITSSCDSVTVSEV